MGNLFLESPLFINKLFTRTPATADTQVWDGNRWVLQENKVDLLKENFDTYDIVTTPNIRGWFQYIFGGESITWSANLLTLESLTAHGVGSTSTYAYPGIVLTRGKKITTTIRFWYDGTTTDDIIFTLNGGAPGWTFYKSGGDCCFGTTSLDYAPEGVIGITCAKNAWHVLKVIIKGYPDATDSDSNLCYLDGVLVASTVHSLVKGADVNDNRPYMGVNSVAAAESHILKVSYYNIQEEAL